MDNDKLKIKIEKNTKKLFKKGEIYIIDHILVREITEDAFNFFK